VLPLSPAVFDQFNTAESLAFEDSWLIEPNLWLLREGSKLYRKRPSAFAIEDLRLSGPNLEFVIKGGLDRTIVDIDRFS
jgi:hypothetical protein